MIRVKMLSDYPFGIAFGGKEVQMLSYEQYLNAYFGADVSASRIDYWDKNALADAAIVHLFGHSNWYYNLIKSIKANNKDIKVATNATFYYTNRSVMKLSSLASRLCPIPNFFSYRRGIFGDSDVIIVNSSAEGRQLTSLFGGALRVKTKVVYNAIEEDFNQFSNPAAVNRFPEQYGLEPGYLLCVSFLEERKNHINLIRAFLRVHDEIKRKLVIVGGFRYAHNSNLREAQRLMREHGDKIVHVPFINRQDDLLKSAYYHCGAHLLPSSMETPGLSNLEALYFNKPILVGRCDPVEEYFGRHAVYCSPHDVRSIGKAVTAVLSQGTNEGGAELIRTSYTKRVEVARVLSIYCSLLGGAEETCRR